MSWSQIQDNWGQMTSQVKENWSELTDADLITIAGRQDQLACLLLRRYGYAKERASKEIDGFAQKLESDAATAEQRQVSLGVT